MPKATVQDITRPLHNLALPALVDELGTLKAQIAELETREKSLRDELIARGSAIAEGLSYSASITEAVRWTLDAKTVRSEMGDGWWNARCRRGGGATAGGQPRPASV